MENPSLKTFSIISKNHPGILYRIAGIFLRRKINVESLEVHTINATESRFTIEIITTDEVANKLKDQIDKIVEVKKTEIVK